MTKLLTLCALIALAGCPNKKDTGSAPASKSTATEPAAKSSDPAAAPVAAGELPTECTAYKAAIDKLASCDKLPAASRDALKQAYDAASTQWANLPAEQKTTLATGCKAAVDAIEQTAAQTCGW